MNFLPIFPLLLILGFQMLCLGVTSSVYNTQTASISVWLSGAAYCGREQYDTMVLGGSASNIIIKKTLYDPKTDLQGFVGVSSQTKQIIIAFRGSSSILNWMDDFEVKQVPYTTFSDCPKCAIHYGFYRSALAVRNITIDTVKYLKLANPFYTVIVTGHSYGAAVAQIISMELLSAGFPSEIYNFGQPRVGNAIYAAYVNTMIPIYWRFTHYQDVVPHLPPITGFGYFHSCREVYEDLTHEIHICSESDCEDPTGSDQFPLYKTNADDHMLYLGHYLSCVNSTTTLLSV